MKKIFALLIIVGLAILVATSFADTDRDVPHKFRVFTANSLNNASVVIWRITGVTTATNGVFGIYDGTTGATTSCAIEGGEATAGDALPMYYFPEGLHLKTALTVVVSNCYVVLEYN